MKYVIELSFVSVQPYYVRDNEDGTWDEIYTPHVATVFTSKKTARSWVKTNTTFSKYKYASVCKLQDEIAKFDEWAKNGFIRRTFNVVDNELSRPYNNESPDEVLAWRIARSKLLDTDVRYEDYETWPELYSVFKCIFAISSYENNQMTFQMRVNRDTEFDVFCEELEKVVDHVTLLDNGCDKVIDIFDHFLCENGNSSSLIIHEDGTYSVRERWSERKVNVSLKDAFDYWKKHKYYN